MVRTPPAGTPAAPTLDAVAVTLGMAQQGHHEHRAWTGHRETQNMAAMAWQ